MRLDPDLLAPASARPLPRHDYERMAELGMFRGERVELLHGVVVSMTPVGPLHCETVNLLCELLAAPLRGRARVRVQMSVVASDWSQPEPDLAVVPPRSYRGAHPGEAFLVVEVADSSLRKDREIKAPLYAAMGVPEYWLVDLGARQVEVHREPAAGAYLRVKTSGAGDTLRLSSFPDVEIRVADLFA